MKSTLNEILSVIKESTANNGQQPAATSKGSGETVQHSAPVPDPVIVPEVHPVHSQTGAGGENFNFQNNETFQDSTVVRMQVPETGKDRLMQQKEKEKLWEKNQQSAVDNSGKGSYKEAINKTKRGDGKRGRKPNPKITNYIQQAAIAPIKQDEEQVAENLALQETAPQKPQELE